MFEFLKGTLVENNISYAVLDVHGVGYKIWIAPSTIAFPKGEVCTLYTSFVIRENFQALYGFADPSTRNLFEVLIAVSGIGPKTALCILSQFSANSFRDAIIAENVTLISSVPGLGKKTAEKIILDLKDKLIKKSFIKETSSSQLPHHHYDAVQALVNLGYSERLASQAIEKVIKNNKEPLELAQLITEALRSR